MSRDVGPHGYAGSLSHARGRGRLVVVRDELRHGAPADYRRQPVAVAVAGYRGDEPVPLAVTVPELVADLRRERAGLLSDGLGHQPDTGTGSYAVCRFGCGRAPSSAVHRLWCRLGICSVPARGAFGLSDAVTVTIACAVGVVGLAAWGLLPVLLVRWWLHA